MAWYNAILILFLFLLYFTSTSAQVDRTLEDEATGTEVVIATVNKIRDSGVFPDDFQFLRRMARVESGDGETATDGGIWQIGRSDAWPKLRQFFRHADRHMQAQQLQMQVQMAFNITWTATFPTFQDLNKPLYSALAVMLYIQVRRQIIPEGIHEQADLWESLFHDGSATLTRVDFIRTATDADAYVAGDITLGEGVSGTDVVITTVNRIRGSRLFAEDHQFLRRMARVESKDGATVTAGGIWQVTRSVAWTRFQQFFQVNARTQELLTLVQTAFNLTWTSSLFLVHELNKPLYSALVVQLYIQAQGETIPDDIPGQADLWHRLFNTGSTTLTPVDYIRAATALRDAAAFAAGDITLGEGVTGTDVVIATVNKIRESGIFPDDYQFLRRMARVESNDGERTTAGGIWHVNRIYAWTKLQSFFRKVGQIENAQRLQTMVESAFNITWTSVFPTVAELSRPLYSALAVRLYIQARNETIPTDIPGQAILWEKLFIRNVRTSEITKHDFIRIVSAMENAVSPTAIDRVLEDGATGRDVVIATINAITDSQIFPDDHQFLRRMARVESNDGETATAGGIWQITRSRAWIRLQHIFSPRVIRRYMLARDLQMQVQTAFNITWNSTYPTVQDLNKPLYSALAVMLYIQVQRRTVPENINGQADLWQELFNTRATTLTQYEFKRAAASLEEEECKVKGIDLIFGIDVSGSISSHNYELLKEFAISITDEFEMGPDHTKVGWINYNVAAWVVFDLNAYNDKTSLHQAIRNIAYTGGGRNVGTALLELYNNGFTSTAGARSSLDVPHIAIVVTSGPSPIGAIQTAAILLHEQRRTDVYAVGIGGYDYIQLLEIAKAGVSGEPERNVFTLPTFETEGLQQLQDAIRSRYCFSGRFIEASIEDLRGFNRSIPEGTTAYINAVCPPEGLTINVCGKGGRIVLFISRTTPTPHSAMYDEIIEVEENQCVDTYMECTSEEESGRRKRYLVSPKKTYPGFEEANEYTKDTSTSKVHLPQV